MKCFLFLAVIIIGQLVAAQERSTIKSVSPVESKQKGNTYAVLIGVSAYANYPSLNYAAKDAKLMKQFLLSEEGGSVPNQNIKILLDDKANSGEIHVVFTEWLSSKKLKSGDRLFVYLAGHGDADGWEQYFLAHDAQPREISKSVGNLEISKVKRKLYAFHQAGVQVILLLDACRTNESQPLDSIVLAQSKRMAEVRMATELPGIITFYAAQDGFPAYESSSFGQGHGLFTWYFVKGAKGEADQQSIEDGKITVAELTSYLKNNVQRQAKNILKTDQSPKYCCDIDDEKELFWVTSGAKSNSGDDLLEKYEALADSDRQADEQVFVTRDLLQKAPPATVQVYNKFQKALSANNLVYGNESALAYYYKLQRIESTSSLVDQARLLLIAKMINYAKVATIKYLLGVDEKLIREKATQKSVEALEYEEMAKIASDADFVQPFHCLETAFELSNNQELKDLLYPKLLFLKARTYFNGYPKVPLDTAIAAVQEALAIDTGAAHLYHLLGMLENERGNYLKAESCISKGIAMAENYNTAAAEIGKEFIRFKRYREASLFYRLGILSREQYGVAYNNLALLNINEGKLAEAEIWFKLAVDKDPSDINRTNLAIYYMTLAKKTKSESLFQTSELFYKQALTTGISKEVVFTALGALYNEKEQFASARTTYLRALKVNPRYIPATYNLIVLYFNNKLYDSAAYYCKQLLTMVPPQSAMYKNVLNIQRSIKSEKEYFKPSTLILIDKQDPEFKPDAF